MSVVTRGIGAAKKVKRVLKAQIDRRTPVYLSPVRRIERVKTRERVCAMTFDDGPMNLPPSNGDFGGKPLTLLLIETLEAFGAKGTFDIVGDTSANYPDKAGKEASASWGGIKFDHYPDIGKDASGGAVHCPDLVRRIIEGGHEITSHTYSHVLFGSKPLVYGARTYMDSFDDVVADLRRMDTLLEQDFGYKMTLMRPPHYVDKIKGGFSSYDACAAMGYQYLGASFDGAGWLPLKSYEAEVEAMVRPLAEALKRDPDALCGQIIFQKDGYNMARRTPVAHGLKGALECLAGHGYKVVTVSDLMALSPFEDLGEGDPLFPAARKLLQAGYVVAFKNNKILPQTPLTLGGLLMMLFGAEGAGRRIDLLKGGGGLVKPSHPYSGAVGLAAEKGVISRADAAGIDKPVSPEKMKEICRMIFNKECALRGAVTHGDAIEALADLI